MVHTRVGLKRRQRREVSSMRVVLTVVVEALVLIALFALVIFGMPVVAALMEQFNLTLR